MRQVESEKDVGVEWAEGSKELSNLFSCKVGPISGALVR